jgi:hypothetical protein
MCLDDPSRGAFPVNPALESPTSLFTFLGLSLEEGRKFVVWSKRVEISTGRFSSATKGLLAYAIKVRNYAAGGEPFHTMQNWVTERMLKSSKRNIPSGIHRSPVIWGAVEKIRRPSLGNAAACTGQDIHRCDKSQSRLKMQPGQQRRRDSIAL